MTSESLQPVDYALTVARAFEELANDAIKHGVLSKPMAATMSAAAHSAVVRLQQFLASQGTHLGTEVVGDLNRVLADLESMAEIVGLVVSHELTPRNTYHVAVTARYTAHQSIKRLRQAEEQLDT